MKEKKLKNKILHVSVNKLVTVVVDTGDKMVTMVPLMSDKFNFLLNNIISDQYNTLATSLLSIGVNSHKLCTDSTNVIRKLTSINNNT